MMTSPVFAVVGATGQQGGATARALLAAGERVRGLTRDPASDAARALADAGAEVVRADLADPESVRAAFDGATRVFGVTTPFERGPDAETSQGIVLADAAASAGVEHVVYSSVGGAERGSGVPHFESKRRVEEHLESLGLPVTFVRPVFFMDNFRWMAPAPEDGELVFRLALPAGVPLQMIASSDVGAVAAAVLRDPARVPGGAIEIAGDERTGEQIAAAMGEAAGEPARYEALPLEVLGDNEDMRRMFDWFAHLPAYQADISAVRELQPDLQDLPTWLSRSGWSPPA
jgi:uncharacterized protein YbjT (DUF2867 family)